MQRAVNNKYRLKIAFLSAAGLFAVGHPASAQSEGREGVVPEEIIVTALRRSERLQDVPVSISALSASDIADAGLSSTRDVLTSIPNVNFTTGRGMVSGSNIVIRGIGTSVTGADQPVAVYVDDVYLANEGMFNMDLLDLDRIEVLRGPQGTLYGRNATAGAVNFISAQPKYETSGAVEMTLGRYDLIQTRLTANLPVVSDQIAVRGNFVYTKRDGYVRNVLTGEDVGTLDNIGGRLQVRIDPAPGIHAVISGDYSRDDTVTAGLSQISIARDLISNNFGAFNSDRKNYGGSAKIVVDAGAVEITSVTGLRYLKDSYQGSDFAPTDVGVNGYSTDQKQFSQELRLASTGDGPFKYVVGAYFLDERRTDDSSYQFHDLAPIMSFMFSDPTGTLIPYGLLENSIAKLRNRNYALFGDATYAFTDALSLTLGARFGRERRKIDYTHVVTPSFCCGTLFAYPQTFDLSKRYDSFLPKATLSYKTGAGMMYATVSKGLKSGGFNREFLGAPVDPTPSTPLDNDDLLRNFAFSPEKLWNYEVGYKGSLLDGRLTFSSALFYVDWLDQQVYSQNGFQTLTSNIDKSRSYGLDLDMQFRPSEPLEIGAALGLVNSTFRKGTAVISGFGAFDVHGLRQPNAPKVTANVHTQYRFALSDKVTMPIRIDVSYRSKQYFTTASDLNVGGIDFSQLSQDGYALVNLRAGIEAGSITLTGFVNNLFDKRYITSGQYNGTGAMLTGLYLAGMYPEPVDTFIAAAAIGRTYGITGRWAF